MRIAAVKTSLMRVDRQNWLFVTIETDEGISGIGEASLEGRELTVEAAVRDHARYLVGQDPLRISHHWQAMYRHGFWRGGVVLNTALSGLEQALWDIKGKALGVPVYELLGGRARDRIRVYTHCRGATPEEAAERALALVAEGFTALKFGSWPAGEADDRAAVRWAATLIETVRAAVGPDVDLMVDNHGRSAPGAAIELAHALAPYNLLFLEELTPPDNILALERVKQANVNVRLATGERLFTKWGFRELFERQIVEVVQPDICHDGGILETRLIAGMAEAYYVKVAPHNPNGPVATAASVHLAAAIPNFLILEYARNEPHRSLVQRNGPRVEGGYIAVPTAPGLGIELDEEVIAAHPYEARDYPGVFDADGAVADV
ncbi:MAG: galactonate dehydratase [Thermomicrobiales bacterium]